MDSPTFRRVSERLEAEMAAWVTPLVDAMAATDDDPFRILIATILSLRTRDTVTAVVAPLLFERADTPQVDKTCQQNCYENECFDEPGPAAFADGHRPCKEKEGFDIEDHEQHRDQIEFG